MRRWWEKYSIFNYIQEKCGSWNSQPLTWMGRVVAVKMVPLPKLVFLLLNAIMDIPSRILNKIQGIFNRFIWGNKRATINSRVLEQH